MRKRLFTVEGPMGVHIVSLAGEHDLSTAPELDERIGECFAAGSRIVVDLTETEFVDSSILAALIRGHARAQACEGDAFAIVLAPDTPPARLFELMAAGDLLAIYPTRDAAVEAVAAEQ
jgi:anti-sigma B factor antagonist